MNRIRLLIADDHGLVRSSLRELFATAPDLAVVGEAADGAGLLQRLDEVAADLVLLDLSMPGPSGIGLIRRLRQERPGLAILVLSMHAQTQIVEHVLRAGAAGHVAKDCDPAELIAAVRQVGTGGNGADPVRVASWTPPGTDGGLSPRERQIIGRLAAGQTPERIADELHLSPRTVGTHSLRLMHKLHLQGHADVLAYAVRHGFVANPPFAASDPGVPPEPAGDGSSQVIDLA